MAIPRRGGLASSHAEVDDVIETARASPRTRYEKLGVGNRTELLVRIITEYMLLNKRKSLVRFRPGRVVVG